MPAIHEWDANKCLDRLQKGCDRTLKVVADRPLPGATADRRLKWWKEVSISLTELREAINEFDGRGHNA